MLTRSLVAASALALLAAGCAGNDDEPVSEGRTPDEVLALAKKTLDETSGVSIDLYGDLPSGVRGLSAATGTGTHDPEAFEGKVTVSQGFSIDVDVVAIGDDVWIKLPGTSYVEADPSDYGAPNPAGLFATDGGLSDLLVTTEGAKKGKEVRGGDNNEEVLVEYSGTVPAEDVTAVIPSASGDDFDVTYTISSDGELREVRITGEFYPDSDEMTYTIGLDDYGSEKDIKAP